MTNGEDCVCYNRHCRSVVSPANAHCEASTIGTMQLTADISEPEIDEALGYLRDRICIVDPVAKNALMKMVDALLDAKLEMKQ